MDLASLNAVAEDLDYLMASWLDSVPDPEIRRGSAVLRRLLVEDQLGVAWRKVGFAKQPSLVAPNLEAMLGSFDRRHVNVALAGGALHGGIVVAGITLVDGGTPPTPASNATEDIFEHPFPLSEYLSSPCAYVAGVAISRRDLIKYMANVRGGVHLASSSRSRRKEQDLIRRVGRLEGLIHHHSKDGLFFEFLSVGQSVARSPHVAELVKRIRVAA